MSKHWKHIGFFWLFFSIGVQLTYTQEIAPKEEVNIDDLGNATDKFQELFFEALKQKAITNYDKAIDALEECMEIDSKSTFIYFELGKNQLALKQYEKAEKSFLRVLEDIPNHRYVLELLFETYFVQHKYIASVGVVEKLVVFDSMFKEQLANLYFLEGRYDDALSALDELSEEYGTDVYREKLRRTITLKISNPSNQISKLEKKIEKNPDNEQNYLNLIFIYSKDNETSKAFEIAKKLLEKKPKSKLVHLALYKFYLDKNNTEEAIRSMTIAIEADEIDAESKYKVIQDFLGFVSKNPQYETQLIEMSEVFSSTTKDQKIFNDIGDYFYQQEKKEMALNFYEKGLQSNITNFGVLKKMLLLQLDLGRFEKVQLGSELGLEMYPSQPVLYYMNGVSLIQLQDYEGAIEILNMGMDYIIDDLKMEADFYKQLGEAYLKTGDTTKASQYQKKATQLQNKS